MSDLHACISSGLVLECNSTAARSSSQALQEAAAPVKRQRLSLARPAQTARTRTHTPRLWFASDWGLLPRCAFVGQAGLMGCQLCVCMRYL